MWLAGLNVSPRWCFITLLTFVEGVRPLWRTLLAALSQADGWNKFTFCETMHLASHLVPQPFVSAVASLRGGSPCQKFLCCLCTFPPADGKPPHRCRIVPPSSRKTWQELHQAHDAKLSERSSSSSFSFSSSQSFSSRTPYEIFMQVQWIRH